MKEEEKRAEVVFGCFILTIWVGSVIVLLGYDAMPQIIAGVIGMVAIALIIKSGNTAADAIAGILFGVIGVLAYFVFGLYAVGSAFVAMLGIGLLIDGSSG